jgi:outer membrane lipoprotein-sorting protein
MEFEIGSHGTQGLALKLSQHRWLLIGACILCFANGCARETQTLEPTDLPVSLIIEELADKRSQLSSFRAVGTLRVEGGKNRWSGRAFILGRMPQSLRLEVLSFFGQPALYLVSDGDHFLFWEPGSDRAYQGFASGNTLTSLIKFPLEDSKTLLLLAGIVPSWDYQKATLFRIRETDNLLLQLQDGPGRLTQRVWLEAEEFAVTRIERLRGSRLELEADFTDFVAIEGSLYPRAVLIKADKVVLSLHYKQFVINEPLQEETFRLPLPEGIEVFPW